jgi:hypothetical protein
MDFVVIEQCSDPSATDLLIQHPQHTLQVRDSRRMVPVGYHQQRDREVLHELNIRRALGGRSVHPIE